MEGYLKIHKSTSTNGIQNCIYTVDDIKKANELIKNGDFVIMSPFSASQQKSHFNYDKYILNLKTKKFGRILLHSNIITSTIQFFEKFKF